MSLSTAEALLDELDSQYSALEAEVGLLRDVLASIPAAAVFVVTSDMVLLAAGGELLTQTGFNPENLQGKPLADVVSSDTMLAMYKAAASGNNQEHVIEWRGRRVRVHLNPLRSKYSSVSGAVAIALEDESHERTRDYSRAAG